MTPMKNLVLMLFPTIEARDLLQAYRRRFVFPGKFHLPAPERLHLTLFSLGLVPDAREPCLRDILRGVPMEPLELVLHRPPVLAEVTTMPVRFSPPLRLFRERLRAALQAGGFTFFGGNRPHITLAYGMAAGVPAPVAPDIAWIARDFALIWSQLPPHFERGRHIVLERYAAQPPAQMRLFQ